MIAPIYYLYGLWSGQRMAHGANSFTHINDVIIDDGVM